MSEIKNKNIRIEIQNLTIRSKKDSFILLKNLSFTIYQNEILALIGESGSGKTTLALALMDLLPKALSVTGAIHFLNLGAPWVRGLNKAMIFQDPQVSLNPFFSIEFQLKEVLSTHLDLKKGEVEGFILKRLDEVKLENPKRILKAFPSQLSGGEKQRVLIAMALLCNPEVLIADEPTASLDLIVRVEILKLLLELKNKRPFSLILITHDISSALKIADRMVILRKGGKIEEGTIDYFKAKEMHPYTQSLLKNRVLL